YDTDDPNPAKDVIVGNNPYDHQQLLFQHTMCCTTTQQHCIQYEMNVIEYYSEVISILEYQTYSLQSDVTLGQFLEQFCFDTTYKCKALGCSRNMIEHDRSFIHQRGRVNISV